MKWIGLTGSLGTGKSTVTKILRDLGWTVLDADALAHEALMPGTESHKQVLQDFGHEVLLGDGSGGIDRAKLAALVFGRPDQLSRLEKIIHPYVRARVAEERKRLGRIGTDKPSSSAVVPVKALFYDVPLLFEKNMQDDFDEVWVVSCPEDIQRSRLRDGRGWSDEEIDRRLKHQVGLDEKVRLADEVIENSGSKADLLKVVYFLFLKKGLV